MFIDNVINVCKLEFHMTGTHQPINNEWRMHSIIIEPPNCYKCTTCGLCGTFNIPDWTMPDCHGETFIYQSGTFWPTAYDANGWTWEQTYIEEKCESVTPETPQEPPYTPQLPPV